MFQNTRQQAAVCHQLCVEARIPMRMWTIEPPEPTEDAVKVCKGITRLSRHESLMVRAAWDIWNGYGKVEIVELVEVLNSHNLKTVADCLKAIANGPEAIDRWLRGESARILRVVRDDDDPRAFPAVQPGRNDG